MLDLGHSEEDIRHTDGTAQAEKKSFWDYSLAIWILSGLVWIG